MNSKLKYILFGLVVAGVILSLSSTGIVLANGDDVIAPNFTQEEIFDRLETIVNWVFRILLITSVFIILITAFQFVTAGDNPETLTKARSRLIWAVVGIALAVMAKSIPTVILSVLNP